LAAVACHSQSVDGYNDIFINSDAKLTIHTIYCGDLNKLNSLRPAVVFTNTNQIEEGTYFFRSSYGDYSYTFKQLEAGKPVMARGLLRGGETDKTKAVNDMCLVKRDSGLPDAINKRLKIDILEANDPKWQETMDNMTVIAGRPALSKGVYKK
jgi:hypothetical protein